MYLYQYGLGSCRLDDFVHIHKYANMRTTIDIPDELYRSLKARAALGGMPVRDVIARLIDLGLRADTSAVPARNRRRGLPPVAIPARGIPIRALSHADMTRLEDSDDEAKYAGPA